jgi:hypothetical protein
MTTNRSDNNHNRRRPTTFRKDTTTMFHVELRLFEALERQERLRAPAILGRPGYLPERPIRHRLGRSLVRLGRRVGGDAMTTPAWQR